jgi:hypothetical protein
LAFAFVIPSAFSFSAFSIFAFASASIWVVRSASFSAASLSSLGQPALHVLRLSADLLGLVVVDRLVAGRAGFGERVDVRRLDLPQR